MSKKFGLLDKNVLLNWLSSLIGLAHYQNPVTTINFFPDFKSNRLRVKGEHSTVKVTREDFNLVQFDLFRRNPEKSLVVQSTMSEVGDREADGVGDRPSGCLQVILQMLAVDKKGSLKSRGLTIKS